MDQMKGQDMVIAQHLKRIELQRLIERLQEVERSLIDDECIEISTK